MQQLYDKIKSASGTLHYELSVENKTINIHITIHNEPFTFSENSVLNETDDALLKVLEYNIQHIHPIEIEMDLHEIGSFSDLQFRCLQDSEIADMYVKMAGSPYNLTIQNLCFGAIKGCSIEVEIHYKFSDFLDFEGFGCLELVLKMKKDIPHRNSFRMLFQ